MAKQDWTKPGLKLYKKRMPEDITKILLRKQAEIKVACNCQYSLEQTVYKLIRAAADLQITTDTK